jgi:hypothetical protein
MITIMITITIVCEDWGDECQGSDERDDLELHS